MNQKYDIRTLYPMVPTHLPLTVKTLFDEGDQTQCPENVITTHDLHLQNTGPKLLIPKPPGQAGCISHGGYSLERQLNWEPTEYSNVQKCVRERIKYHILHGNLKGGCPISRQPPDGIQIVQAEIAARYPILNNYQDNWPTRDMISRYLSKGRKSHY